MFNRPVIDDRHVEQARVYKRYMHDVPYMFSLSSHVSEGQGRKNIIDVGRRSTPHTP